MNGTLFGWTRESVGSASRLSIILPTGFSGNDSFGSRPGPGPTRSPPSSSHPRARSRRARPMVFRMLPGEFRAKAKAKAEGRRGNRVYREKPI